MQKIKGTLLLAYYHPIIFDLAVSFSSIFEKVEICVANNIKDNYGTHEDVIKRAKEYGFDAILLNRAIMKLKAKQYALVGVDGVFEGDKILIDVCSTENVPYFCINGYPHNFDEPSNNILSLSWFLPQMQYKKFFPSEAHIRAFDWGNMLNAERVMTKNICVYYPCMHFLKRYRDVGGLQPSERKEFSSFIHKIKELNKETFAVFEKVKNEVLLNNYDTLSQKEVWDKINASYGLIHLKHGDCPGIAIFESMIIGRVPIVMRNFVLASFNQEVLIDGHSAIVCDTIDELVERAKEHKEKIDRKEFGLETSTRQHIEVITNEDRQKQKLYKFVENCL